MNARDDNGYNALNHALPDSYDEKRIDKYKKMLEPCDLLESAEIIDLQVILPVRRAGNLSGQDVPGLAGCVTICGLQCHGISCRDSKLNVHFRRMKVLSVQTFQDILLWYPVFVPQIAGGLKPV